jgi:cobalt-zinc-cadmium efflux system protein
MMTLHARIRDDASGAAIVTLIKARLHEKHGIGHATIEIEGDSCAGADCD